MASSAKGGLLDKKAGPYQPLGIGRKLNKRKGRELRFTETEYRAVKTV